MIGENYVRSKTIVREFAVIYIGDCVEGHVQGQHLLDPPSTPHLLQELHNILIDLIRHIRIICAIQIIIYATQTISSALLYQRF